MLQISQIGFLFNTQNNEKYLMPHAWRLQRSPKLSYQERPAWIKGLHYSEDWVVFPTSRRQEDFGWK
jgi:hypothetical protein